ncbi:MAG: hypothetical protein P8Y44_01160 [Acidobacteriota bacterium]
MGALEKLEDARPTARVYFLGDGSPYPGWYLQWYVGVRLVTLRLPLISDADAFDAGTKASELLDCAMDCIQIEGPVWPEQTEPA